MAGMSNYLRNKLVDAVLRGVAFVGPGTLYYRLTSNVGTAATAGSELSGTGYAPVSKACSTANWAATNAAGSTAATSSGTNGTTSNNTLIDFGTAGSAWGSCAGWELWDAASGGNRWFYGEIVDGDGDPAPRTISSGDPVQFPISAAQIIFI